MYYHRSYSTPRVFQEFQQKFPDFQGTYQKPAQRVYKCVNVFLETGSVLRKKGSGGPTKKKQLKRLKRLNKELQRPQINASGD
jgi:transposase